MSLFGKFIPEGEAWPKGYGMAYRVWSRRGCIAYPVPFNWLAMWLHANWAMIEYPSVYQPGTYANTAYMLGVRSGREKASHLTEAERRMRDRRTRSDDEALLESLLARLT